MFSGTPILGLNYVLGIPLFSKSQHKGVQDVKKINPHTLE
jgi:hypothetical protein